MTNSDKGREAVKNPENLADVICTSPPRERNSSIPNRIFVDRRRGQLLRTRLSLSVSSSDRLRALPPPPPIGTNRANQTQKSSPIIIRVQMAKLAFGITRNSTERSERRSSRRPRPFSISRVAAWRSANPLSGKPSSLVGRETMSRSSIELFIETTMAATTKRTMGNVVGAPRVADASPPPRPPSSP